jgi:hypothetical protein
VTWIDILGCRLSSFGGVLPFCFGLATTLGNLVTRRVHNPSRSERAARRVKNVRHTVRLVEKCTIRSGPGGVPWNFLMSGDSCGTPETEFPLADRLILYESSLSSLCSAGPDMAGGEREAI